MTAYALFYRFSHNPRELWCKVLASEWHARWYLLDMSPRVSEVYGREVKEAGMIGANPCRTLDVPAGAVKLWPPAQTTVGTNGEPPGP